MGTVSQQDNAIEHERALIAAVRAQVGHLKSHESTALTCASVGAPPAGGSPPLVPPAPDGQSAPDSFSGYEVLREVHRGAQGVVYQALQKSTRRKVALKVLKSGAFATTGDRVRFEREVQILAQLNHPNIVAIHDSGTMTGGEAFFVMDYISGQPLDEYLEALSRRTASRDAQSARRAITDKLTLFVKICEAVNAAHLRGVIHRDLKPRNIYVDSAAEPYILDFGLAKLAINDLSDDNGPGALSLSGQFIGSLPWASPEQAEGRSARIDIRTDVYSLGVVLYQMLTGRFPYDVTGSMHDVLDQIIKTSPTPPRRALPHDARTESGLGRVTAWFRRSLSGPIDEELETIVLKCLSKQRDRRYQSAGELARDVRHYLAGEPIEAKRDSIGYVFRKHLQRHRAAAVAGSSVAVMVVVALIVSLMFWRQAAAERDNADAARMLAQQQTRLAEEREQKSQTEVQKLRAVHEFFQTLLAHADPTVTEDSAKFDFQRVLESTARQVASGPLREEPEISAAIETVVGCTYWAIAPYATRFAYAAAERHLHKALDTYRSLHPEPHPDVIRITAILANVCLSQKYSRKKVREGEILFSQAMAMKRELLGPDHPEIATGLVNMGDRLKRHGRPIEAEQPLRDAYLMRQRVLGPGHADTIRCGGTLGDLLIDLKRYGEAEPLHRLQLDYRRGTIDPNDKENAKYLAASLRSLGADLLYLGRFSEAEPILRECLEMRRKIFEPSDRRIPNAMSLLGGALTGLGRLEEAAPLLESGFNALATSTHVSARHWREAIELRARYFDAAGQRAAADECRQKLSNYQPATDGAAEADPDE